MDGKRLEYKGEEALKELEKVTANAREVQESILKEILTRNGGSEYLRKYMEGSTDVSEYKGRVPVITYAAIRPYIQRIANGEDSSIISGHPITEMLIRCQSCNPLPLYMFKSLYMYCKLIISLNQYGLKHAPLRETPQFFSVASSLLMSPRDIHLQTCCLF